MTYNEILEKYIDIFNTKIFIFTDFIPDKILQIRNKCLEYNLFNDKDPIKKFYHLYVNHNLEKNILSIYRQ